MRQPCPSIAAARLQVHTATAVGQRRGLLVRQLVVKIARVAEAVQRQAKHLREAVAAYAADPSAGASQVRCVRTHMCA